MAIGRNRCVVKGVTQKKVISHDELMDRIRKSLYYGGDTSYDDMEVSRPFAEYASELFSEPHKGHSLNRLNIVTAGGIQANPCTLIIALIYLDRLNACDPNYVRRITPSELFIVSMMISTKFYCGLDEEIYLNEWAEQGNISEKRMKELEIEFLCAIDWNVYISNEQFFDKLDLVEKTLAQREGLKRGWLTYTELINLLPSFTIAKFFLNNIAVMAVSYAASVMTIAGAFFIVSHIPGNGLIRNQQNNHNNTKLINTTTITTTTTIINDDATTTTTTTADSITDLNDQGSCNAINIEEELKMLEKEYAEENNKMNLHKNLLLNDITSMNFIKSSSGKIDIQNHDGTNLGQWNNLDDENCRNTFKNYTPNNYTIDSLLWYMIMNQGKSLIDISFDWFKFI